ncbi:MAG: hypothetical protein JXB38_20070 [Anaerolineales bacterium]|nr:hypothetical protein [Anaerolineales bacterium]
MSKNELDETLPMRNRPHRGDGHAPDSQPRQELGSTKPSQKPPEPQDETRATPINQPDPDATRTARVGSPRKPTRSKPIPSKPLPPKKGVPKSCFQWLLVVLALIAALITITVASGYYGYRSGETAFVAEQTATAQDYLQEQYQLGLQDLAEERYTLALQRFEYIFSQDPEFSDAADRWVEIMLLLDITATPTPPPATVTPTPTEDPRPIEELFNSAQQLVRASDWNPAIDTLLALRKSDPNYRFVEVDGMLYLALRNRGVNKIIKDGNLEGGLYDLSLAEHIGPLDRQADIYRGWARLYLQGNSFWYAYPDIAAQYYGQVAGAAPNLRDISGISAWSRYYQSLVHYAEQLADKEDWCAAYDQYLVVFNAGNDASMQTAANNALEACLAETPSPTPETTASETPTLAITLTPSPTLSAGTTAVTPLTSTPTLTNTPGGVTATFTLTPTITNTLPASTPTFTSTIQPTTPTFTATATTAPPATTPTETPIP